MTASAPEAAHGLERPAAAGDWFGQPRGLTILFLTDMWEQFSFYGMRALLVFYMTKALHIPQQNASMIYGFYAAGVFFTPILGGVIADRWLGRRNAVVLGGATMAAGHFMMAFPHLFYPALATIALGNGLFLPSLPGQIDSLYAPDDPRRRSAYNVFYVGINIGGLLAPLVAGTLGETLGWDWGFGCAGVGMVIGLLIYVAGGRYLPADRPETQPRSRSGNRAWGKLGWSRRALARRFAMLLAIAGCVVVFRGAYEQLGNTLALWADGGVDRRAFGGFVIPATWFQSLNPAVVILATPLYVSAWNRQAARGREPSSVVKMAMGALLVAASFLLLAGVNLLAHGAGAKPAWPWLALFVVAMTAGELFILPVGLGLFGRSAPAGLSATTVATWFFAGFCGNLLAGWIGGFWTTLGPGVFFAVIGFVAAISAGLLVMLAPAGRWMEQAASAPARAPSSRT